MATERIDVKVSVKDQIYLLTQLMDSWYASGFTVAAMLLEEEIAILKEKLDHG